MGEKSMDGYTFKPNIASCGHYIGTVRYTSKFNNIPKEFDIYTKQSELSDRTPNFWIRMDHIDNITGFHCRWHLTELEYENNVTPLLGFKYILYSNFMKILYRIMSSDWYLNLDSQLSELEAILERVNKDIKSLFTMENMVEYLGFPVREDYAKKYNLEASGKVFYYNNMDRSKEKHFDTHIMKDWSVWVSANDIHEIVPDTHYDADYSSSDRTLLPILETNLIGRDSAETYIRAGAFINYAAVNNKLNERSYRDLIETLKGIIMNPLAIATQFKRGADRVARFYEDELKIKNECTTDEPTVYAACKRHDDSNKKPNCEDCECKKVYDNRYDDNHKLVIEGIYRRELDGFKTSDGHRIKAYCKVHYMEVADTMRTIYIAMASPDPKKGEADRKFYIRLKELMGIEYVKSAFAFNSNNFNLVECERFPAYDEGSDTEYYIEAWKAYALLEKASEDDDSDDSWYPITHLLHTIREIHCNFEEIFIRKRYISSK